MYPEIAKKIREQGLGDEDERSTNIEYQIFDGESIEQRKRQEKINRKKQSASKRLMEQRKKWCWGRCGPKVNGKVASDSGHNNTH
jgi:hypothetical protein